MGKRRIADASINPPPKKLLQTPAELTKNPEATPKVRLRANEESKARSSTPGMIKIIENRTWKVADSFEIKIETKIKKRFSR